VVKIREPIVASLPKGSLISTYGLAQLLGLSEKTVKKWVEQKRIRRVSIGGKWLVDTDSIAEAMEA
jgi:excisionase family DNA binding protein